MRKFGYLDSASTDLLSLLRMESVHSPSVIILPYFGLML